VPARFAAISDIHANIYALEAVLEDIRARGIGEIVNLGDHVHGPIEPAATADLLMRTRMHAIRGNQDRIIPESTLDVLAPRHLEWLTSLPPVLHIDEALLCHGTPSSDETYLLETVTPAGARSATSQEVNERLGDVRPPLLLCGHTHLSRVGRHGEVLIVNPGSVGLPAYEDDAPHPHRMETGSPHARYAVLTRTGRDWSVELIAIPYDWTSAAASARRHGREDWARRLESGWAQLSYGLPV
jgi:putative phosphoesterase